MQCRPDHVTFLFKVFIAFKALLKYWPNRDLET
jgi:hypothetical protein